LSKQTRIQEYVNTIVGATVTTKSLCISCNCTLPTVLTYINNNPQRFQKTGHGSYRILAESIAVEQVASRPSPQIGLNHTTFDW